jgi:WD40 repeat protein
VDGQPNGPLVATGSADGIVRLWNPDDNKVRELRGHGAMVFLVRFSPDGKLVASAAQDGTVRVWDVARGVPHWHAPLLLMKPARLLTHTGWIQLEGKAAPSELPKKLADALQNRARYAVAKDDVLCMQTHGGQVEIWNRSAGTMHAQVERAAERIRATSDGCAVLAAGHVELIQRSGKASKLALEQSAIALGDGDELLVATERELIAFRSDGAVAQRATVDAGVTALARKDATTFVVGYRDGSLELVDASGKQTGAGSFERHPASAPSRIVLGPAGTVLVGFANGMVGMWELNDGTLLASARLHGPVVHAALADGTFVAATELGDAVHWDVSVLSGDRCKLLRDVWEHTPVIWRGGRAVRQAPPTNHPCK